MKIVAIDNRNDLFSVSEIIDYDVLDQFNNIDLNTVSCSKFPFKYERFPRNVIESFDNEVISEVRYQISKSVETVNRELDTSFGNVRPEDVKLWWDLPGFSSCLHLDNSTVLNSMQIYLGEANENLGTVFYNSNNREDVRYRFKYIKNTGYIMFNNEHQYHSMEDIITKNDKRISSYFIM